MEGSCTLPSISAKSSSLESIFFSSSSDSISYHHICSTLNNSHQKSYSPDVFGDKKLMTQVWLGLQTPYLQ